MKRLLAVAGLVFMCSAARAATVDFSGTWVIETEVQGIAVNETCLLKQSADAKITGSCDTSVGKFELTGTVRGDSVSFSHPAKYQDEDMTVSFFAKLSDPVTMTGSVDLQPLNAGGAFGAKKKAEK
jgi:hypothetical protein